MNLIDLQKELQKSIHAAIEAMGIEKFKKTSFFLSNDKTGKE